MVRVSLMEAMGQAQVRAKSQGWLVQVPWRVPDPCHITAKLCSAKQALRVEGMMSGSVTLNV